MVQSASQYVEAYRFIIASKNSGYDKMKVLLIFVILGSSIHPLIYSHFSNRKWLFFILKFEKIALISFFFQLWEPLYTFGRHIDPNFSYNHLEYQKLILVTNFVTTGPSKANLQWVMCELTKLLWQNVPQNTSSSLILKMLSFGHGFYVNYWIVSNQICCPKLPNLQKKQNNTFCICFHGH